MAGDSPSTDLDPERDRDASPDRPDADARATAAALRAGIDAVDDVVVAFGPDGTIREANRAAAAAAGRPPAALASASVDAVIAGGDDAGGATGDRDRFRAAVAEALETGRATVAVDVPTDAGPVAHEFTVVAPADDPGRTRTLVAVGRRAGDGGPDRAAVDRMTDAFFSLDRRWHVTYANEEGRRILATAMGLDATADVEGRHLWTAIPEARNTTFHERYREAMATQEPTSFESYYEPLGVWLEVQAYPSPSGLSVYFRDVTERRRRREALASHRRALRKMYEVVADRERTFTEQVRGLLSIGREELDAAYGSLSRVDGDDYTFEVVDAAAGPEVPDPPDEGDVVPLSATNCGVTVAAEETVVVDDVAGDPDLADRAANVEWGIGSYLGAPVFVDDEVYGTFCVHDREARDGFSEWDVTLIDLMSRWIGTELERRRARERLERQNERLDRFAAVVSHDLRSPMNVVTGSLELAAEGGDPEHFERARDALDRMDALVDDVLSLARAGESVDVDPGADVDLGAVAERAWATVDTGDATLRVTVDGATVAADESRLRQLFANLLHNAVEHGGDAVTVTVGRLADGAGFFVADDGPGVPPEERDRVFESGHSGADGTGLGLAIVAEVADAHGWRVDLVDADADARNPGARFEFRGVDVDGT